MLLNDPNVLFGNCMKVNRHISHFVISFVNHDQQFRMKEVLNLLDPILTTLKDWEVNDIEVT